MMVTKKCHILYSEIKQSLSIIYLLTIYWSQFVTSHKVLNMVYLRDKGVSQTVIVAYGNRHKQSDSSKIEFIPSHSMESKG